MTVLYFTATGNSLQVAKAFGGTQKSIPQLVRNKEFDISDDVVGIISPTYVINLPFIVENFLEKANITAEYVFAIVTCGIMIGNTARQIADILAKKNIRVDYTNKIAMTDNYLLGFDMDKEQAKLPKKNVSGQIENLVNDVSSRKKSYMKTPAVLRLLTKILNSSKSEKKKNKFNNADNNFSVSDSCNLCGVCKKACPVKNIEYAPSLKFLHKCERCFACIHNCPQTAIHLKGEKSSARFRNAGVTLNEIITANDE